MNLEVSCICLLGLTLAAGTAIAYPNDSYPLSLNTLDWSKLKESAISSGVVIVLDDKIQHEDPFYRSALTAFPDLYCSSLNLSFTFAVTKQHLKDNLDWVGVAFGSEDLLDSGFVGNHCLLLVRSNGTVSIQCPKGTIGQTENVFDPGSNKPLSVRLIVGDNKIVVQVNEKTALDVVYTGKIAGEFGLTNFGNDVVFSDIRCNGTLADRPSPLTIEQEKLVAKPLDHIEAMPRIGVRKVLDKPAEFFNTETNQRFVPRGFNYTVLEPKRNWHGTFNVGRYDPETTEKVLATLEKIGANVVRFWAWGTQDETGFTGNYESRGLNEEYLKNVIDFMQRAIRHRLYLIPILDEFPKNAYYSSIEKIVDANQNADKRIVGYNRQYLSPGRIEAKAKAAADFVRYIAESHPNLLNGVLGWSLANEIHVVHDSGPFNRNKGTIRTANGKSYDMGDKNSRQNCYDENILFWANRLADAIREVDPNALVTAGMWTSEAHGRPPINGLLPDDKDPRRPPRPSVFASPDSKLSFIDIHVYQWDGTSKIDSTAHETEVVLKGDKPVLVGEFNVFEKAPIQMRAELAEMAENIFALGYAGALLWDWNLNPVHENTGSYAEEDISGYVMELLKKYASI